MSRSRPRPTGGVSFWRQRSLAQRLGAAILLKLFLLTLIWLCFFRPAQVPVSTASTAQHFFSGASRDRAAAAESVSNPVQEHRDDQ